MTKPKLVYLESPEPHRGVICTKRPDVVVALEQLYGFQRCGAEKYDAAVKRFTERNVPILTGITNDGVARWFQKYADVHFAKYYNLGFWDNLWLWIHTRTDEDIEALMNAPWYLFAEPTLPRGG